MKIIILAMQAIMALVLAVGTTLLLAVAVIAVSGYAVGDWQFNVIFISIAIAVAYFLISFVSTNTKSPKRD